MSEIPEKIDNSNNELQKIETKISDVSKKLDYLRKSWKDDELALAQIQELELALKYLENQKAEIIAKTQQQLPEVNKKDKKWEVEYEKTSDESKRTQAVQLVEQIKDNPENIDFKSLDWDILSIFFKLLKVVFWWSWSLDWKNWLSNNWNEDIELSNIKQKLKDPNRTISNFDFETLINSKDWKKFEKYQNEIIKYSSRFDINPWIMLKLFIKEWSHWNPSAGPSNSSAIWLWQITTPTWNLICDKIWPKQYWVYIDKEKDRFDPSKQILASCMYLDYCARLKWVDHATAIIYYHMWHWRNITDNTAQKYYDNNPAIARVHGKWPITAASYQEAAREYYLV